MKVQELKRMIEVTDKVYIADDGKEFKSQLDCEKYESQIEQAKRKEKLKELFVMEDYPPCDGGENYENHYYKWYKLNDINDLGLINEVYGGGFSCDSFPNYICIDQYDEDDCEAYGNTLDNCEKYVKELFDKLGFDVTITKRK